MALLGYGYPVGLLRGRVSVPVSGFTWLPASIPDVLIAGESYEVVERIADDDPVLRVRDVPAKSLRTYDPFGQGGLFLRFARLQPDKESVLSFANTFGSLWADRGSRLSEWRAEIFAIRAAAEAWESIDPAKNREKARQAGGFRGEKVVRQLIEAVPFDIPALSPAIEVSVGDTTVPEMVFPVFDLLVAIRLQLADAVFGRAFFRDCPECGNPIPIAQGVNQPTRRFCSDACKLKAYRRRQKLAQEMRAEGTPLRTIAKELDSDMETVKGWVGEKSPH